MTRDDIKVGSVFDHYGTVHLIVMCSSDGMIVETLRLCPEPNAGELEHFWVSNHRLPGLTLIAQAP